MSGVVEMVSQRTFPLSSISVIHGIDLSESEVLAGSHFATELPGEPRRIRNEFIKKFEADETGHWCAVETDDKLGNSE